MARPKKNNADYFPHDADMRNDPKIRALRRRYGIEGYAVWNMFIEILTDSDFFEYEWNALNIELLAGDFDIDPEVLAEIVSYCQELKLLIMDGEKIYSKNLKERFESLLNKRSRQQKPKKEGLSMSITNYRKELAVDKPQSKGKERKGNTPKEYGGRGFLEDWNELRNKHLKKPSFLNSITSEDLSNLKNLSKDYSREQFREALTGLFKQKKMPNDNSTMQSNPKHFLTHFNPYLTAFHDRNTSLYGKDKELAQ